MRIIQAQRGIAISGFVKSFISEAYILDWIFYMKMRLRLKRIIDRRSLKFAHKEKNNE